jgi:dihydropteroate synthase
MSTAPYLESEVTEELERERIAEALRVVEGLEAVISVDTLRASVAELALKRGASIINDVSGLKNDEKMARVVKEHGASLLAMAHSSVGSRARPMVQVRESLRRTLAIARRAGIQEESIVLDPGIGFFREEGAGRAYSPQGLMPWHEWDSVVLADLGELRVLGRPLCVGLSRKSFLGKILKLDDPGERLPGSIAATAMAVMNGADMIRTHDVKETVQAVRVVEAIMRRGPRAERAL